MTNAPTASPPVSPPVPKKAPAGKKPRAATLTEFQSAAAAIEERPLPRSARAILTVIVGLVVTMVVWASLAHVDRIVVGSGRLVTSKPMIVVQPLETGVIRSFDVTVGSVVKAGEGLVTLDSTFATADTTSLVERLESLMVEAARLRAEIERRPYAPADGPAGAFQRRLFEQREAEYRSRVSAFEASIAQAEAAAAANREAQASLRERLRVLGQIVAMREELLRRNVGSQLQLMEAQLNHLTLKEQLTARVAEERELAFKLDGTRQERESFMHEWTRQAAERLLAVTRESDGVAQELAKAQRRSNLVNLTTPADGVVLEVAQRSVGSVVREAEPLVTIVPLNVPLEVEAEIKASDIGRVRVGDPVRIKLDALPFQQHGNLEGSVRVVTEDAFRPEDERRMPVYKARIAIERDLLRNLPPGFRMIPGMTAAPEIVVGTRSVISYFLFPIIRVFDESLREP